ncbi:MAG: hypothetical protein QM496_00210 [Verrucomicrobiota bacterium]
MKTERIAFTEDPKVLDKLGRDILDKLEKREPLIRQDLVNFCRIGKLRERKGFCVVGLALLFMLVLIILVQLHEVLGWVTENQISCFTFASVIAAYIVLLFQGGDYFEKIGDRLYCRHCNSSFGLKDVEAVLRNQSCPYCVGAKPIIVMGFEKQGSVESTHLDIGGSKKENSTEQLSEHEFHQQIKNLQELYWKRAGWNIYFFLAVWIIVPIAFVHLANNFQLKGWELTGSMLVMISICGYAFWRLYRLESKHFNQVALRCPTCDQSIPLSVAERGNICHHCGCNLSGD